MSRDYKAMNRSMDESLIWKFHIWGWPPEKIYDRSRTQIDAAWTVTKIESFIKKLEKQNAKS